jgi:hypothetical protein
MGNLRTLETEQNSQNGGTDQPMPEEDAPAPEGIWRKFAALGLVIAAIGLPINHLLGYGLLVLAVVLIFTGSVTGDTRRWGMAALLAAIVVAGHILLPAARIEEGHNIFIGDDPEAAATSGIPQEAFRLMAAQYAAQYPRAQHCQDEAHGCSRLARSAAQNGYAFSADGIYDHPDFSRRVTGINFSDPVTARFGVINDQVYNWSDASTDIPRFERDRRFWKIFDRFHLTLPLFVMYKFPQDFVGSALCWRGNVLWEGAGEHFAVINHAAMTCRRLQPDDIGRRIFGVSILRNAPLAVTLKARAMIRLRRAIEVGFTLLGVGGIIMLLVRWSLRRTLLPFTLIAGALLIVVLNDALFVGGLRALDGGDDGLTYVGYGRLILRNLLAGNWAAALRGEEPVFIFTPALRYFRAIEGLVFGDTFLGYLSVILALPFLVFAVFRRFLPVNWALGFILLWVFTPIGALFGSTFTLYVKAASRGYADPLAFAAFLAALVLVVPRPGATTRMSTAFWAALLFALAVFTRPNLVLAVGIMLAGAAFFALRERRPGTIAALGLGFAPILLSPLHNWVFGHSLVPFSDNVIRPETMRMLPTDYMWALWELLRLDVAGEHVVRGINQLAAWLSGPTELIALIPLHAAAIAILVRVGLFGQRFDPWLRLIALATLLQHGIALCYVVYDRYHLLTWLLTCLVTLVWVNAEGLALLDHRFDGLHDRWKRSASASRLKAAFARLRLFYGLPDNRAAA